MATLEEKPSKSNGVVKEGNNLLGSPTFQPLDNGRFKCVETGHELPAHAQDSYSQSKRCRIGLIDFALTHSKPPLNMFKQDPLNSSKVICKLTGDTVNKSEEHIWKHINGKRFFNKLEQMEADKLSGNGDVEMKGEKQGKGGLKGKENGSDKKKKDKKKMKEKKKEEIVSEMRDSTVDTDSEELEFWIPPEGERWDFDDGGDRWGSDSESGDQHEEDDGEGVENEEEHNMSAELSTRAKRMSIEIGPSSFASRKKKSKTKSP
ncbi:surfeit locus protein 2-like [Chenopodium quinoa]|uniref:surfeit locus protein 2-like n=1 Tax=Chenopodium quinoa TaxID=63459 RepID=UPI000B78ED42|nr:surfeit locus protein 2-like [Chenopodium quinoa]